MALRKMFDSAFPPASPPQVDAVAGYIGGGTPHIWSDAEWAASMQKSGARYKLPIFVRVPPTPRDPRAEARFCLDWAARHQQPKGTLIALDYETAVDATYLGAFDDVIVAGGYKCIVYGTRRTVLQNPRPSGGYWTATWNNIPHLDAGASITQYGGDTTLGQPWDINAVADSAPLWDTQEESMDAETKTYIDGKFEGLAGRLDRAVLFLAAGVSNTAYSSSTTNPRPLPDMAKATNLQELADALKAGQPITLTQEQLDQVKAALQTLEGSALVQLAVSPA